MINRIMAMFSIPLLISEKLNPFEIYFKQEQFTTWLMNCKSLMSVLLEKTDIGFTREINVGNFTLRKKNFPLEAKKIT